LNLQFFAKKLDEAKIAVFNDPSEFLSILPKISKYSEKVKKNRKT